MYTDQCVAVPVRRLAWWYKDGGPGQTWAEGLDEDIKERLSFKLNNSW